MKNAITFLFATLLLLGMMGVKLSAQEQVITVKTALNIGEKVRIKVVAHGSASVKATGLSSDELKPDWTEYTLKSNIFTITGPVKYLAVFNNKVKELTLEHATYLDRIDCEDNQIESLDLSSATNLTMLFCHKNKLRELDVTSCSKLSWLNCSENSIKKLNLGGLGELKNLVCSNNPLASLELQSLHSLSALECVKCNFSKLDLSQNNSLQSVNCGYNSITSLNLNGCSKLKTLSCENNLLKTLDISPLSNLTYLRAYKNSLTNLDFSNSKTIHEIYIESNKINEKDMSVLIHSLPLGQVDEKQKPATVAVLDKTDASEENICSAKSAHEAKEKGWKVVAFIGNKYEEYEGGGSGDPNTKAPYISFVSDKKEVNVLVRYVGKLKISGATGTLTNGTEGTLTLTGGPVKLEGDIYAFTASQQNITEVDVNNAVGLTSLDLSLNKLSEISIGNLKELKQLRIEYNQLNALDVSKNTKLTHIYCYSNNIPQLELSNLKELFLLTCFSNKLTLLDISQCPNLTKLSCDNNPIRTMDFSHNPKLENIWCASTQMTSIDVTKNVNLKQFICNNNSLSSLDLSKNAQLNLLFCAKNQLANVDITNKPNLKALWIFSNKIKRDAMQGIVEALPQCNADANAQFIVINTLIDSEANECDVEQVNIARSKNWRVIDLHSQAEDPSDAIDYTGSNGVSEVTGSNVLIIKDKGVLQVEGIKPATLLRLITTNGENVMLTRANNEGVGKIAIDSIAKGVYLIVINDEQVLKVVI